MSKKILLMVLIAVLLSGGTAMGQNAKRHKAPKARTEQHQKATVKKKKVVKQNEGGQNLNKKENRVNIEEERVFEKTVKQENIKDTQEPVYMSVEQMPLFPGGESALMKYVSSHINYPSMAAENSIQGKVIVKFIVEKDGSISDIKVARSVDKDLDKEAVRVVSSLPKFTPGRQNGQAVRVWYTLPVTFKLPTPN